MQKKSRRSWRHRKPITGLTLVAALAVGLLATSASSALAVPTATGGNGSFTAAAHLNPPPEVCATYSLYNAHLTFTAGRPGATIALSSDPSPTSNKFQWGENGDGTFNPQTPLQASTPCTTGPGAAEAGFTGTLTDPNGPVTCTLSGGSYTRTGINVVYNFTGVAKTAGTGTCPLAPLNVTANLLVLHTFNPPLVIPPGIEITDLTACNSIIAPTSCVLTNGTY